MNSNREKIVEATLQANGFVMRPLQYEQFGCKWIIYPQDMPRYSCYLVIASSTYFKSKDYEKYINNLQSIGNIDNQEGEKPIVLILVNENQKTSMFGILLYWQYGHPFINPKPNLRNFKAHNITWFMDVLKATQRVISLLDPTDFKIVKSVKLNDNTYPDSYVVYLRDFSERYKMTKKEQNMDGITRNLFGTPQSEYPSDILDAVILNMIKKHFPQAQCISSTYLFGLDILKLQTYKTYEHYKSQISIFPGFYAPNYSYLSQLQSNVINLQIDVCYHRNLFKINMNERPLFENEYEILDATNGDFQSCAKLINTYHPLSEKWM